MKYRARIRVEIPRHYPHYWDADGNSRHSPLIEALGFLRRALPKLNWKLNSVPAFLWQANHRHLENGFALGSEGYWFDNYPYSGGYVE
jgi:hypothetical protein